MKNRKASNSNFEIIMGIFAIAVMLFGASFITYYYVIEKINSCTSDPIRYAADKFAFEKNMTYDYISFNVRQGVYPIKIIEIDFLNGFVRYDNQTKKLIQR